MSGELKQLVIKDIDLPNETSLPAVPAEIADLPGIKPELLLSRLSFSHFVELLLADTPLKRAFYEVQAVKITGRCGS